MRSLSQKMEVSNMKRVALAVVAWATYVLAFIPLYHQVGPTVTVLGGLPVVATAWFFGMSAGLLASLLALLLDVLLVTLVQETGWIVITQTSLLGYVLLALIGVVIGRLRDLGEGMKRELAERQHTERELAMINRASQALSATLDLDQVLATVLEEVRHLMGVIACSVWLIDPATGELVCRQATGPQSQIVRGWRLAPGEGIAGWVAHHGESLIVPDTLVDERHSGSVGQQTGLAIRSLLNVPLKTKQGVIGALQVMDEKTDRFSTTDLTLLEPLAASAAVAIDNARLVETLHQRTVELEASNEELRRLTYVASHDLRAPLVNLMGFATELCHAFEVINPAIIKTLPHLDEEERQAVAIVLREDIPEALEFIDSSVTDMNRLINALLELSRLSRCELELEQVDMEELVQTILQTVTHQIAERQVRVTVDRLPKITADQASMQLIMGNLLSNAILYLTPNCPGEIEITAESNHDETTFRIHDNGRGIAEEDMYKVFAPLRRAGKPDVPGEGMGLAYAQTLIRRHGGHIWCESELGVGTTFTFTISNHPLQMETKGNNHV